MFIVLANSFPRFPAPLSPAPSPRLSRMEGIMKSFKKLSVIEKKEALTALTRELEDSSRRELSTGDKVTFHNGNVGTVLRFHLKNMDVLSINGGSPYRMRPYQATKISLEEWVKAKGSLSADAVDVDASASAAAVNSSSSSSSSEEEMNRLKLSIGDYYVGDLVLFELKAKPEKQWGVIVGFIPDAKSYADTEIKIDAKEGDCDYTLKASTVEVFMVRKELEETAQQQGLSPDDDEPGYYCKGSTKINVYDMLKKAKVELKKTKKEESSEEESSDEESSESLEDID